MFCGCVKFLIIDLEAPLFVQVAGRGRDFVTHLEGVFYNMRHTECLRRPWFRGLLPRGPRLDYAPAGFPGRGHRRSS